MPLEITTPADGAIDVSVPVTPAGNCDLGDQAIRTRGVWTGGDSGWIPCTITGETWVADASMSPPSGALTSFEVRRRLISNTLSPNGWILPAGAGSRIDVGSLHAWPAANDGVGNATASAITTAFLTANAGAAWRAPDEGGVPVIQGADIPRGLRINTQVILRDCRIVSDTRVHGNTWGFPGSDNDCPVIFVEAANTVIEYCDIIGEVPYPSPQNEQQREDNDDSIPSRGVWVAGTNTTIRYCDISGVRGAVQAFNGTVFEYNYCHGFAFGWQSNRAGGTQAGNPDEVTHNNALNNYGYTNFISRYNYLDCRYGRVSYLQPGDTNYDKRLSPIFRTTVYNNGVEPGEVVVGDPIDGFTWGNYLINGNGAGLEAYDNYAAHTGRVMLCQGDPGGGGLTAAADFSRNVFEDDRMDDFQGVANTVYASNSAALAGSCNQRIVNGVVSVFPANFFYNGAHGTTGCTLVTP